MADLDPLVQALLDSSDAPQLLVDGRRLVAFNQAARTLLGTPVEGADVSLVLRHPQALDLIAGGEPGAIELRGIGGPEQEWRLELRRLSGDLMLVRLHDLVAERSAERIRTDFVANASHELRTPLASIIGYAETLAEEGPLPDSLREQFGGSIEHEGKRMLRLVDELMSLSKISADRYVAPTGRVPLDAVIEQAVVDHRDMAATYDGTIDVSFDPATPAVIGDRGQVGQVVANLISNALRYGVRDGRSLVSIRVAPFARMVRLTVTDQGDGIAPEHLPRLTERFYRVDPARSRDGGGTGLGLAIVKHVVERHRGTMHIRSRVGEGTQVEVQFPAATET